MSPTTQTPATHTVQPLAQSADRKVALKDNAGGRHRVIAEKTFAEATKGTQLPKRDYRPQPNH